MGAIADDGRFVGLLRLLATTNRLSPDVLRAVADSEGPINPAELASLDETARLVFRRAFADALAGCHWRTAREAARALLGVGERRDETRLRTVEIRMAKTIGSLDGDLKLDGGWNPLVYEHGGKTFVVIQRHRDGLRVIDLSTLGAKKIDGDWDDADFAFFVRDGVPHTVVRDQRDMAVVALAGRTGTNPFPRQALPASALKPETVFVIDDKDGHPVAASHVRSFGNSRHFVRFTPLTGDGTPRDVDMPDNNGRVYAENGRAAFAHGVEKLTFVDGPTMTVPDLKKSARSVAFDNDHAYAATDAGLAVIDTRAGKIVTTIACDTSGHEPAIWVNGTTALVGSRTTVSIVDLASRKVGRVYDAPGRATPVRKVTHDGRTYLVWGAEDGSVSIADAAYPGVLSTVKVAPGAIRNIVPFVRGGRLEALAFIKDAPPLHLSL